MKNTGILRNIIIGVIDGLTLPFALAAGLSSILLPVATIATACIITSVAGMVTMYISSYLTAKTIEAPSTPMASAVTIGLAYIVGGLIVTCPYFFISTPLSALKWSAAITIVLLLLAGYYDSKLNGANGFVGALRISLTGAAAATVAFFVAKLFI